MIIPFIIYLLGCLLHLEKENYLERVISYVLIPTIFLFSQKCNYDKTIAKLFLIGSLCYIIPIILNFIFSKHAFHWGTVVNTSTVRLSINVMPYIGIHPIYLSLYLSVAFVFGLSVLNTSKFWSVITFIILPFIIFLGGKSTILSLLVIAFIQGVKYFNKKIVLTASFSALLILLLVIYFMPITWRVLDVFNLDNFLGELNLSSSTSIRVYIWKATVSLIKENWIIGIGFNNIAEAIFSYLENDKIYLDHQYNTHNQFLSVFLGIGFIGFLLLLLFYLIHLHRSKHNKIYFFLLIIFLINSLTENVLERQFGAVLTSFLLTYFLFSSKK
ncbi:O-antigen ligase family protein [Sediminitomix flava]|nr:O-antigen ligase family protein [Sediminitomix flava]